MALSNPSLIPAITGADPGPTRVTYSGTLNGNPVSGSLILLPDTANDGGYLGGGGSPAANWASVVSAVVSQIQGAIPGASVTSNVITVS